MNSRVWIKAGKLTAVILKHKKEPCSSCVNYEAYFKNKSHIFCGDGRLSVSGWTSACEISGTQVLTLLSMRKQFDEEYSSQRCCWQRKQLSPSHSGLRQKIKININIRIPFILGLCYAFTAEHNGHSMGE